MSKGSPFVSLRLSRGMLQALHRLSEKTGRTISDLIRGEIQQLLSDNGIDYTAEQPNPGIDDTTKDA